MMKQGPRISLVVAALGLACAPSSPAAAGSVDSNPARQDALALEAAQERCAGMGDADLDDLDEAWARVHGLPEISWMTAEVGLIDSMFTEVLRMEDRPDCFVWEEGETGRRIGSDERCNLGDLVDFVDEPLQQVHVQGFLVQGGESAGPVYSWFDRFEDLRIETDQGSLHLDGESQGIWTGDLAEGNIQLDLDLTQAGPALRVWTEDLAVAGHFEIEWNSGQDRAYYYLAVAEIDAASTFRPGTACHASSYTEEGGTPHHYQAVVGRQVLEFVEWVSEDCYQVSIDGQDAGTFCP